MRSIIGLAAVLFAFTHTSALAQAGLRREVKLVSLPGEPDFREVVRERGPITLEIVRRYANGDVLVYSAGQSFRGFAPTTWLRQDRAGRLFMQVPLGRIFFAFSTRQIRLADPRAAELHAIASRAPLGRSYAFKLEAEEDGRGCLVWGGPVQVWELADLHGDAVQRALIHGGVGAPGWTPMTLGDDAQARLAPRTVVPVLAVCGDQLEVLVSGPGQSTAVARVSRAAVRPVLLANGTELPALRANPSSRPIGAVHARRDPTPLHGQDRSWIPLVLAPGTAMRVLCVEERVEGGTWLKVAVPGLRGWIEGHVLDPALEEREPQAASRVRGFGAALEGR